MPNHPSGADQITIELDSDQALVLFDYLASKLSGEGLLEQAAEIAVLDDVLGQLEKRLVAPFCEEYESLLIAARARLAPLD